MNDKMPQPNPLREAYFGELHCHTAYSLDAYAIVCLGDPDDAYRFAKGESLATIKGGAEPVRLTVPLDFCAVTDHSPMPRAWKWAAGYPAQQCGPGGWPGPHLFLRAVASR